MLADNAEAQSHLDEASVSPTNQYQRNQGFTFVFYFQVVYDAVGAEKAVLASFTTNVSSNAREHPFRFWCSCLVNLFWFLFVRNTNRQRMVYQY